MTRTLMRLHLIFLLLGELHFHIKIPLLQLFAQKVQLAPQQRFLRQRFGGLRFGRLRLIGNTLHAQ